MPTAKPENILQRFFFKYSLFLCQLFTVLILQFTLLKKYLWKPPLYVFLLLIEIAKKPTIKKITKKSNLLSTMYYKSHYLQPINIKLTC